MKKRKGILLLLILTVFTLSNTQTKPEIEYGNVLNSYKCNNSFDSIFIESLNIALSAYPELKDVQIHYEKRQLKTIMAARPYLINLFRSKDKKTYKIILSNNIENHCDELFCKIPEKALIGILGHEMAHILSYYNKSTFQLICYGVKYFFNKKQIERETDFLAIKHGFGEELLEYNIFVLNSNLVSKKYLKNRQINYLSINEIEENLQH
jgi:hypothetical protein